jgi:hypothetical protein
MKAHACILTKCNSQILILPLLLCASLAFGQGFGTIVGTVTDPSGAVIAGAKVRVDAR